MNQKIANKIEASDTNINKLLKGQKFTIDYFQREYRWQEKHIKALIDDLTNTFMKSYNPNHKRSEVANYQSYYLGPVVFSINPEGKKSIIDGQQRITSITLLLIYLNHCQKNSSQKVGISELIFSEKFGEKSFNMSDDARDHCLRALFEGDNYEINDNDNETIKNMLERYEEIEQYFPEEIIKEALPYFIDWFVENVIMVEIIAYSDDNAYTIFETMNNRGLNLTPTEMLKGYVLSKINDKKQRSEINNLWKEEIQKLHEYGENMDLTFFQAWFRGKYAITIRPGKVGSENQDFEIIGSKFQNWFKDNHKDLFKLNTSSEFYEFFKYQFPFYVKWYLQIYDAYNAFNKDTEHIHYIKNWGIAESLQEPLLLAPVNFGDKPDIIKRKIDFVSRYIETFTVRRSINYRKFGQTSIKYTMFNLVKLIRNNTIGKLAFNLKNEIKNIPEEWNAICEFSLHGQNRKFVKHILSRITSYIDTLVGKDTSYVTYYHPSNKPYEIEHIWADKFEEHLDEFQQKDEFQDWRNSIGALVLLPQGTNQSFNSDKYEDKLKHYLKENTFVQTLHPAYYVKNPNFIKTERIKELKFKPHPHFKKVDLEERQRLFQRICESLWNVQYFNIGHSKDIENLQQ